MGETNKMERGRQEEQEEGHLQGGLVLPPLFPLP
jgi:hypothetical protein